jgi:hypothetical protein
MPNSGGKLLGTFYLFHFSDDGASDNRPIGNIPNRPDLFRL